MLKDDWQAELGEEILLGKDPLYTLPLIAPRHALKNLAEPLATLYATGLRPEEYLSLQPSQLQEGYIQLPDRIVPCDRQIPLGLPIQLENHPLQPLFQKSGRRLVPSAFRHAYATHRLEDGMPLLSLYTILGHRNISITQQYLDTAVNRHRASYQACHPLARERGAKADGLLHQHYELLSQAAQDDEERAIYRLFYATGLRISEFLALREVDLNREEGKIFVRQGKFDKDRYLLVDRPTLAAVPPGDPLFSLNSATPILERIEKAARKAGFFEFYTTVSPHSFRRTFATQCYLGGMQPALLKLLLGHERLESTRIYLDIPESFIQAAYDRR